MEGRNDREGLGVNRYDTTGQLVHSHHRYDEYGPDGTLTRTSLHRLQAMDRAHLRKKH